MSLKISIGSTKFPDSQGTCSRRGPSSDVETFSYCSLNPDDRASVVASGLCMERLGCIFMNETNQSFPAICVC